MKASRVVEGVQSTTAHVRPNVFLDTWYSISTCHLKRRRRGSYELQLLN